MGIEYCSTYFWMFNSWIVESMSCVCLFVWCKFVLYILGIEQIRKRVVNGQNAKDIFVCLSWIYIFPKNLSDLKLAPSTPLRVFHHYRHTYSFEFVWLTHMFVDKMQQFRLIFSQKCRWVNMKWKKQKKKKK